MTKDAARDALMGAISMALKDPVLQQGFEIICKENAELRDKNKALEQYADLADEKVDKVTEQLIKVKKLIAFWVNDFYDVSSSSSKYEERHKALVESEQFLKEAE